MTSIYATLREHVENGLTPEEAAEAFILDAAKDDLAAIVRPLLVLEARRYARAGTRAIEADADRRIAAGEDPMAVRARLGQEEFWLPPDRYVRWDEATADEHLERARYQRRLAGACMADAERHETAAAQITAAGVRCLRDLDATAPVAVPA